MPNVQQVQLCYIGTPDGVLPHLFPSPALHTLIAGQGFMVAPSNSSAWSQITRYCGPAFSLTFVLSYMSNLVLCHVTSSGPITAEYRFNPERQGPEYRFPHLQVLNLSHSHSAYCLSWIEAPRIRKLEACQLQYKNYQTLFDFVARSRCSRSLSTLTIRYGRDDRSLYMIIMMLPALHTLILYDQSTGAPEDDFANDAEILDLLACKPMMLSRLTTLKVQRHSRRSYRGRFYRQSRDSFVSLVRNLAALQPLRLESVRLYVPLAVDVNAASLFVRDACALAPPVVDVAVEDILGFSMDEDEIRELDEFSEWDW